jgi:hypothetical protein
MKNQLNPILLCCVAFLFAATLHAQTHADVALNFVRTNAQEFGLQSEDVKDLKVINETHFRQADLTNVYIQQFYLGIPIHNAIFGVHIRDGHVLSWSNRFCDRVSGKAGSTEPVLTQGQALLRAAEQLGYPAPASMRMMEDKGGSQKEVVYEKSNLSLEDIPVRLVWLAHEDGRIYLTWEVCIYETTAENFWLARVDAGTGQLIDKNNLVVHCNFDAPGGEGASCSHSHPEAFTALSPMDGSSYRVFQEPVETPNHGGRSLVNQPADAIASPYGWHDTNGAAGPEYTITRGNNVHAYLDLNNDNAPDPGSEPDGGAGLDFDFALDLTMVPSTYRPAAVTNLFYWNSYLHDFAYQYGFDEGNGNFQVNNYGKGGLGGDDVRAEAQDGGGTNNANFYTPADGSRPRMQMYRWTYTVPNRDSDLDNGVIAHEYAHGVSNRLTGGPSNVGCLWNAEQMGEGWSDFYALMSTWTGSASDRGIGTYVLGQAISGPGIRPAKYSTDLGVNAYTYAHLPSMAVPHGVGFVWCTMLWEMVDGLVDAHGASAGFEKAMHLVHLGMILQPCSPGFVDGRNAILKADSILYGQENYCVIWNAFAKRGLGYSALQGSTSSRSDGTAAYDLPCQCIPTPPTISCPATISLTPGPGECQATYCFPSTLVVHYDPVAGQGYSSVTPVLPTFVAPGYSVSNLTQVHPENWFNVGLLPVGRVSGSPAIVTTEYLSFQVSLPPATDLSHLTYYKYSYLANGATKAAIRSSLDGFAADIDVINVNPVGGQLLDFNLRSLPFTGVPVSFRIYFFGAPTDRSDWCDLLGSGSGAPGLKLYASSLASATDCAGNSIPVSYTNFANDCKYGLGTTKITATATDAAGNTASCYTNIVVDEGNCGSPVNVFHKDTTTNSAKIQWKKGGGSCITGHQLRYRYEISPGIWSSWSAWVNKTAAATTHAFSGLLDGTFHQYQIRSKCGAGRSVSINGWFWTLGGGAMRKIADNGLKAYSGSEAPEQEAAQGETLTDVRVKAVPNPAKDHATLYLGGFDKAPKTVTMMDLMGRKVFQVRVPAGENELEVDLKRLNVANGTHFIHVDDGKNRKTERLIIQR